MRFLIIDGHNLAYRFFYTNSGTVETVKQICIDKISALARANGATHACVVFDNGMPTFRHEEALAEGFEYKQRDKKDDEIKALIHLLQDVYVKSGKGLIAPAGFEADDVIATLATKASNVEVLIYSGDKDLFALAGKNTRIIFPCKGQTYLISEVEVFQRMGIFPHQIPCFKGLVGDASDSIPGIDGIGEKTAAKLLRDWVTIEQIYQNFEHLTPKEQRLLDGFEQKAIFYRHIATMQNDLDLGCNLKQFATNLTGVAK